jgi:hypothetical protein
MGPTKMKLCFLLNQTTICVVAGEPHPQPQYQTAIIYIDEVLYKDSCPLSLK